MKIACIGWGSLIWEQKGLLAEKDWRADGPELPVEFLRQSSNGRLTLVISPDFPFVQTLWTTMKTPDLKKARSSLMKREGCQLRDIGYLNRGEDSKEDPVLSSIGTWLTVTGIDAAIWTNLPEKFNGLSSIYPSIEEAIKYLRNLAPEKKKLAEEYIRKTPRQITTRYRAAIEAELGWTPFIPEP